MTNEELTDLGLQPFLNIKGVVDKDLAIYSPITKEIVHIQVDTLNELKTLQEKKDYIDSKLNGN